MLGLLLLTGWIYKDLFGASGLTWDDDANIFANPYYQAKMLLPLWTDSYFGLYVPFISTVWGVLYWLFGGAAWPFRILNLILHFANIILVWWILRGLATRWKLQPVAVILGLTVFALHPMQVHAVAWISGGRDLLGTFMALAALSIYFRWPMLLGYLVATSLFAIGLLCKPSVVVLPVLLPLLAWLTQAQNFRRAIRDCSLWMGMALLVTVITLHAQSEHVLQVPWYQRPLIAIDAFAFYLRKLFTPWSLSANYGRTPQSVLQSPLWPAVTGLLLTLVTLFGLALAWNKDRRWLIALAWFILLLPVSGVLAFSFQKISTTSDHYHYLPMVAVAAMLALFFSLVHFSGRFVSAVLILLLPTLSFASFHRVKIWLDDSSFFFDMAKTAPHSYSTALGMSVVMCKNGRDYESGVRWSDVALRERPDDIMALANKAYCYLHSRKFAKVIDMEFILRRLNLAKMEAQQPTAFSSFLATLGSALIESNEFDQGFHFLCEAFRVKPSEPRNVYNLRIASEILRDQGLSANCDFEKKDAGEPAGAFDFEIPEDEIVEGSEE